MDLVSGLAIYFIVWWLTLFAVLPWGVRSQHESGEEIPAGTEPGAPMRPALLKKMAITTVIAAFVWAFIYWIQVTQPIAYEDIPFMPDFGGGYSG
jgi:predicted secreted protein